MKKSILFIFSMFILPSCVQHTRYRDVPDTTWQKLNTEQKQLIVDESFHKFMQKNNEKKRA